MKRLLAAGVAIFVAWTAVDALAHRAFLRPLYESGGALWRPLSEMSPALVTAVTVLLIGVFLAIYQRLVRPKSVTNGLWFGGLLGVALGASSGLGTYIHSPIPVALAWGWFILGTVKGLIAGALLGALVRSPAEARGEHAPPGRR